MKGRGMACLLLLAAVGSLAEPLKVRNVVVYNETNRPMEFAATQAEARVEVTAGANIILTPLLTEYKKCDKGFKKDHYGKCRKVY